MGLQLVTSPGFKLLIMRPVTQASLVYMFCLMVITYKCDHVRRIVIGQTQSGSPCRLKIMKVNNCVDITKLTKVCI